MIQAKVRVQAVSGNYAHGKNEIESIEVLARPVCDKLNEQWSKWTPAGEIKLTINNPDCFGKFIVGKEYLVNFTEA
jgi:hypothetical protein